MRIKREFFRHFFLIAFLLFFEVVSYLSIESFGAQAVLASLVALVMLLLPKDSIVYSVVFMLPNQRLFTIPGTDFSLINLLVLFILCTEFSKIFKANKNIILLAVLIMVYSFVPTVLNRDILFLVHAAKTLSVFFVFNYFILKSVGEKATSKPSFHLFYVSGVIAVVVLGSILDPGYSISSFESSLRFAGGDFNNPNILGFEISFAISLLLVDLYYMKRRVFLTTLTIVTLMVFGFMTQSRSFYFISVLSFSVFFLIMLASTDVKKIFVAVFAWGIILLAIAIMGDYIMEIFNAGIERIIYPKNDDISATRFTLWSEYLRFLYENPYAFFMGIGFKDVAETVGALNIAHNAVIEVIISWGLIGFLLFFVIFFKSALLIRTAFGINRRNSKIRILGYLPLLVLFLSSMTGHNFLSNPFIIKFLIGTFILFSFCDKKTQASDVYMFNQKHKF